METRKCEFEGCERKHHSKGLCRPHYLQHRRGKPLTPNRTTPRLKEMTSKKALKVKIIQASRSEGECWIWPNKPDKDGYGFMHYYGKQRRAHRLVYELLVGDIPEGLLLDHINCTRRCVNPEHLRPVSRKQNAENLQGATVRSKSGVLGVYWDSKKQKWFPGVKHLGKTYQGKRYDTIQEAEAEVRRMRNKLFTHNALDRL